MLEELQFETKLLRKETENLNEKMRELVKKREALEK